MKKSFIAVCAAGGTGQERGKMLTKLLVGAVAAGAMSVPLAGVASADVSFSVGGTNLDDGGPSTATTTGPSIAFAMNNSTATATGIGNIAIAAFDSTASATGNLNQVTAIGGSTASVNVGNHNNVTAIDRSTASVTNGSNNNVWASNGSKATVTGTVLSADANSVTAVCGGVAFSAQSNQIRTSAPCLGQ